MKDELYTLRRLFTHSSPILKYLEHSTEYVCPKCNHLNQPKPRPVASEDPPPIFRARTQSASASSMSRNRHSIAGTTVIDRHHIRPHSIHEVPSPLRLSAASSEGELEPKFPKIQVEDSSESEPDEDIETKSLPLPTERSTSRSSRHSNSSQEHSLSPDTSTFMDTSN